MVRAPGALVVCVTCSRRVNEDDAERLGWRYRLEGTDLRPVCALCAYRERQGRTAMP